MEQRVSLITLGVADLDRARRFYEALGWTSPSVPADGVVFFQTAGMVLALWGRGDRSPTTPPWWTPAAGAGSRSRTTSAPPRRSMPSSRRPAAAGATIGRPGAAHVLGRVLGCVHRPRRPPVGGCPQPVLDPWAGWGRHALARATPGGRCIGPRARGPSGLVSNTEGARSWGTARSATPGSARRSPGSSGSSASTPPGGNPTSATSTARPTSRASSRSAMAIGLFALGAAYVLISDPQIRRVDRRARDAVRGRADAVVRLGAAADRQRRADRERRRWACSSPALGGVLGIAAGFLVMRDSAPERGRRGSADGVRCRSRRARGGRA